MYIDKVLLEKRIHRLMMLYSKCNEINDVIKVYKKNVAEFLQDSKVEIYCLHCVLENSFQWYREDWDFEKLLKYKMEYEEDNLDNDFEIDFDLLDEIRDNVEMIENRLLEGVEIEENKAEEIKKDDQEIQIIEIQQNVENEWSQFVTNLKVEYKELLYLIIDNKETYDYLHKIAEETHKFPEMIVEEINEISIEIIGDTVVELENNQLSIFEDYLNELRKYIC